MVWPFAPAHHHPSPSSSSLSTLSCNRLGPGRIQPLHFVAARIDTDHVVGSGQVSVTGRYDSKKDSFGIDTAFATDDNNTLYGSYMVTDERICSLGLESGFNVTSNKRVTIDTSYFPPSDAARLKVLVRQGKTKMSGTWQAPCVKSLSSDMLQQVKYEFETKLSPMETLKLGFDSKTKAAKVKYGRKLDAKNKVDMEYAYPGTTSSSSSSSRGNSAVTLKLSHTYSLKHSFSAAFNYGVKKIAAEWEWKTDKGPWTVNASFPFNASPKSGDLSIKRRFEF